MGIYFVQVEDKCKSWEETRPTCIDVGEPDEIWKRLDWNCLQRMEAKVRISKAEMIPGRELLKYSEKQRIWFDGYWYVSPSCMNGHYYWQHLNFKGGK